MQLDIIENIIVEHIKELEKLGYDMSEDNIINIVNGFIDISNSILPDGMQKTPNKELNDIISSNLYNSIIKIYKKDYSKAIKSEKSENIELMIPKRKMIDLNAISKYLKDKSNIELNKELLKYLESDRKFSKKGKDNINNIGKLIKENKNIIKDFQSGKLNKLEEDIITSFLKKNYKI